LRTSFTYRPKDINLFKSKLLDWAKSSTDIVWLDSNQHRDEYSSYDAILALDAFTALKTDYTQSLKELDAYITNTKDWIFGYIGYGVKNGIEDLSSRNDDNLEFPDIYFFQPQKLFFFRDNCIELKYLNMVSDEIELDLKSIENFENFEVSTGIPSEIHAKITKAEYIEKVNNVLSHLKRGDIYEMNFCQEFYIHEHNTFNPVNTFVDLNNISKPPFACYFRHEELYAICSSPERYIKKQGPKIISQPIKGTSKRGHSEANDLELISELQNNPKEISENVMIVDLVRNDLSKVSKKDSVNVEELCKIYSFEQVHQMISTISAELESETVLSDILKATFPMGSMTGAPKISAMEIIEEEESTKRGLYSGCIGYISPEFDFDFNVVIRSILHNVKKKYTSMMVGSAITAKSDPEKEYDECLVKAKALFEVLHSNIKTSKINSVISADK
jgi:para-aminobenzoate synthetase component 1